MNMQNLLKQAQKMQKEISQAENELHTRTYEATLNGGLVKATVSGNMTVADIDISDTLLKKENKEVLQDMLITALNDAFDKAVTDKKETMKALTGGIKMPGGF